MAWGKLRAVVVRYRWAAAAAVVLACGAIIFGLWYSGRHPLKADPVAGTSTEIQQLSRVTAKLQASFSATAPPAKAAGQYLNYTNSMANNCARIAAYYGRWQQTGSPRTHPDFMSQSHDLCLDTAKLVAYSRNIYVPLQPLLTAGTTPHRYQTFALLANRAHSRQLKAAHLALNQLQQNDNQSRKNPNAVDFPSDSLPELKQLIASLQASHGLGYLPALRTFQLQLMGERQLFWVQYAGIDDLVQTLHHLASAN